MSDVPSAAQIAAATWYKSSHSAANNECVEIARTRAWVGVRDSKNLAGPALIFRPGCFTAFIKDMQSGRLDAH